MYQCNDGDVDGDDGQLMASCLEEGCPLSVETAGSPNICLANPSNLVIVMLMLIPLCLWQCLGGVPVKKTPCTIFKTQALFVRQDCNVNIRRD